MMKHVLRRLARNSRGATAIEYGLIAALIVIAMFSAMSNFAGKSVSMWNNVAIVVLGN
jgi:pilus assembly protein Flp/PilA